MKRFSSFKNGSFMRPKKQSESNVDLRQDGPVHWMDGSSLLTPFDPPKKVTSVCIAAALVAAIGGGFAGYKAIDFVLHGEERMLAEVQSSIARDVSYDLPIMQDYIKMDDEAIQQSFEDAGYATKNLSAKPEDGLDIVKAPADTNAEEVFAAYESYMSEVDAVTAASYLNGSWRFSTDRSAGVTMSVHYSDLKAATPQEAIESAMEAEGWTNAGKKVAVTDEGVDEMGNTYRAGTIKTGSGKCTWRISVCDLSAVYPVSGLPETAQYVGIRITK